MKQTADKMPRAALDGVTQPSGEISVPRSAGGGYAIGVLVVDTWYPLLPGNVANASTFDFPVLYQVLHISAEEIFRAGPELIDRVVEGAVALEAQGVRAIVGACGTFANYQSDVLAAVSVPVFMSILTQVPFILQSLSPKKKLGILAAADNLLTDNLQRECGITDTSQLAVTGAMELPEFQQLVRCEGHFDSAKLEGELIAHLEAFAAEHPDLGALLIQCSDLPPYAMSIQRALGVPVFDMPTLMEWLYRSVVRHPYAGFL